MKNFLMISFGIFYLSNASASCRNLKNPNSTLKCIVGNHIAIKAQKLGIEEADHSIGVASQMINPELELEAIDREGTGFNSELSLVHTFELGGKRAARKKIATQLKEQSKVSLLATKENLIIQTVSDLYRYRQIGHELHIVEEIISTFDKITKQYRRAGKLSPEDRMSVSVFSMALEENKLKKSALENEKRSILTRINSGLESNINLTKGQLPKIKKDWPDVFSSEVKGSAIKRIEVDLKVANAEYSQEKALSWPNLAIGPKVEIEKGDSTDTRVGFALTIPLPFYQANGAGRARALVNVKKNEVRLKFAQKRLELEKQFLIQAYKKVAATIHGTLSKKKVELKHKDLHTMIDRGVVSAPIVIELHRQIMDYYEQLHEQERQGIQALWRIAALEGQILTKELK
jgi:outer membrane protein TolC